MLLINVVAQLSVDPQKFKANDFGVISIFGEFFCRRTRCASARFVVSARARKGKIGTEKNIGRKILNSASF